MEVLVSFLVFLIKLIGWAIVAIGAGIYCVWSVLCQKIREDRKHNEESEGKTAFQS